nr:glycine-rich cell wall structural protein 1.8-like [Arachis hypogaea]
MGGGKDEGSGEDESGDDGDDGGDDGVREVVVVEEGTTVVTGDQGGGGGGYGGHYGRGDGGHPGGGEGQADRGEAVGQSHVYGCGGVCGGAEAGGNVSGRGFGDYFVGFLRMMRLCKRVSRTSAQFTPGPSTSSKYILEEVEQVGDEDGDENEISLIQRA